MRAQTTLDFAIGIAIFLGVVVFAFSFVPGILEPFELSNDEEPSLSDRVADSVSTDLLGSPAQPHVLDRYCTVAFFDDSVDADGNCQYDGDSLGEVFDLDPGQNVNITLEGNVTAAESGVGQLCWADEVGPRNEPGLVERGHTDCESDDVVLARGDDVEGQGTTITSRRVVSLHGRSVTLEVVVW